MNRSELSKTATVESLAEYALQNMKNSQSHHDHVSTGSVREVDYQGHHIVIRTTYQIEVDGVPVEADLHVGNDGRVHYHAIPNIDFSSAVDLVQQLIDSFPDDFTSTHTGHSQAQGDMK
jgi:hypothetical protein